MSDDERPGLVEALIRAARERGDFDNLPGRGQPLGPDDLAGLHKEARLEARLMRSVGELPAEVYLVREIRALRLAFASTPVDDERIRLERLLSEKIDELTEALKSRRLAGGRASIPVKRG